MRARVWLACWAAAVAGAIAGCSGDGSSDPTMGGGPGTAWDARSGSRLQARYLTGEDGSRVWGGWFDSTRNEPCRVARGEGGRYYCFPEANRAVYKDARCREPAAEHRGCAHRYTAVARGDRRCGNETVSLWEEGEALPPGNAFRLVNDFCEGPEAAATGPTFALTRRIPDADLVRGSTELSRPDLRVGPRMINFDDGAVAPLDLHDGGRSKPCVRVDTTSGSRCLPESLVFAGAGPGPYFADPFCTVPVAHANAPACLVPTLALKVDASSGCGRVSEAFRVGQRLDPREVYSGSDCVNNRILPGHFYLLGDKVDLTGYPELKVMEDGGGRIKIRTYAAADGIPIPPLGQHLFDSQLQAECKVAIAGDGRLRCLPLGGPGLTLDERPESGFADAACTRPLARYQGSAACGGPAMSAVMVARASRLQCLDASATGRGSPDDADPGRWEMFQLGARHEGEVFFKRTGGCETGPRGAGEDFYELGSPLPPETFVAFREG